jgi:hypothetical protein
MLAFCRAAAQRAVGVGQQRAVRRLHWIERCHYLPIKINTPAAIARIAIMVLAPEKLILSSGINPPRISQIASKSMPRFLVSLIAICKASFEVDLKLLGEPDGAVR